MQNNKTSRNNQKHETPRTSNIKSTNYERLGNAMYSAFNDDLINSAEISISIFEILAKCSNFKVFNGKISTQVNSNNADIKNYTKLLDILFPLATNKHGGFTQLDPEILQSLYPKIFLSICVIAGLPLLRLLCDIVNTEVSARVNEN